MTPSRHFFYRNIKIIDTYCDYGCKSFVSLIRFGCSVRIFVPFFIYTIDPMFYWGGGLWQCFFDIVNKPSSPSKPMHAYYAHDRLELWNNISISMQRLCRTELLTQTHPGSRLHVLESVKQFDVKKRWLMIWVLNFQWESLLHPEWRSNG